jgi:phage tail sheath protein FI
MPVAVSYPGIYIQELPSTAHTITAAPTSITVFVGYTNPFKTLPRNFNVPVEIFSFSDYEREFGGTYQSSLVSGIYQNSLIDSNVANAVNQFFLNGGSDAFVVAIKPANYTNKKGDGSDDASALTTHGSVQAATVEFGASPNGIVFTSREPIDSVPMTVTISNPQTVTVTVTPPNQPSQTQSVAAADIVVSYGTVSETYRKVNLVNYNPDFIETRIGTPGNPVSSLVTVSADTNYPAAYPLPAGPPVPQPLAYPAGGQPTAGATGVFDLNDFNPVFQTDSPLDKLPIFNLMAIPGIINNAVLSEALAFCERKLAFLVMDPPVIDKADGADPDYVGKFIDQSGDSKSNIAPLSQNGALYFPYLKSADPLTGNTVDLPPSGFVTGIYARTDLNRGVWKAPAGLETTVLDTTGVVDNGRMTNNRHGDLNLKGVNCLRTFPTGTVVFGARTLVSSNGAFQQWKYVPVRRMALFIEQTLYQNLTWVIFEPNDDPLWTAIRTTINNFMLSLFSQGALQGKTPSQAFQVKCDSFTTTLDDQTNGIVNIIVAFAPLKPAEFVIIKIAQLAGQVQQ